MRSALLHAEWVFAASDTEEGALTNKSQGKKDPTDHQRNERTVARWTSRVGVFTLLLVLCTIVSDWIFFGQLNIMHAQLNEMVGSGFQADRAIALLSQSNAAAGFESARIDKLASDTQRLADYSKHIGKITDKQLTALQTTADALKGQVALMQSEQRPWLSVSLLDDRPLTGNSEFMLYIPHVLVENVGRSPAYNVNFNVVAYLPYKGVGIRNFGDLVCDSLSKLADTRPQLGQILFPGEKLPEMFAKSSVAFLGEDLKKMTHVENGQGVFEISFIGCVDYTFGTPPTHHQTGFIYDLYRHTPPTPLTVTNTFIVGDPVPASDLALYRDFYSSWRTN